MRRMLRILRDFLLVAAVFLMIALIVNRLDHSADETLSGLAHVLDGDTLVLQGVHVRLAGIDAPELQQVCVRDQASWMCGREARARLVTSMAGRDTVCHLSGTDKYRRRIGHCLASGLDLGATQVRDGYAVAYGDYGKEEAEARHALRGIWASSFEKPQDWRRNHGESDNAHHIRATGWWNSFLPVRRADNLEDGQTSQE